MQRYDPIHIHYDEATAFLRIHANTARYYACLGTRAGCIDWVAISEDGEEASESLLRVDDVVEVIRQALSLEPAMIDAVVGHLAATTMRRGAQVGPLFEPIGLLRWTASIAVSA